MDHPLSPPTTGIPYITACAPMVRYSKLPFRATVREYNVSLAYSPMILASVFRNSSVSREAELKMTKNEPVIVQFAANNSLDAADAAELVAPFVSGVDLNCGCPQKWAISEGIGCALMKEPELVKDIVQQVKRRTCSVKMTNGKSFPCSIKIRIHDDLSRTIDLAKRAEAVGADWVAVHGRTSKQRNTEPVDYEAIKMIKESLGIPVIVNGDINNLAESNAIIARTNADGVMAARGLLQNPAMFTGVEHTPVECVKKYMVLAIASGTTHFIFHHHLMYMLESSMSRAEKRMFNILYSIPSILDYMEEHYGIFI